MASTPYVSEDSTYLCPLPSSVVVRGPGRTTAEKEVVTQVAATKKDRRSMVQCPRSRLGVKEGNER